jgi:translation initiation factor IF-3
VAGIIEADAASVVLASPGVERDRLGAAHVGFEAAEPEQAGRSAVANSHRNSPRGWSGSDLERLQDAFTHVRCFAASCGRMQEGARSEASEKPHVAKSRVKSGNFRANGVDLLTDNPDSEGSRNSKEVAPIRRPMRAQAPVQKDGPRINDEIRVREVHLIDKDGANLGTVPIADALAKAQEAGLDLVEISPNATPPIVKILDFGKYKYQEQKKQAEARKKQKVVEVKEIKFRPMIDDHDYQVKMRSMERFFEEGDKVKVTLRFRGREMAHMELGTRLLNRVKDDTLKLAKVESEPRVEGRQMVMVLAPR